MCHISHVVVEVSFGILVYFVRLIWWDKTTLDSLSFFKRQTANGPSDKSPDKSDEDLRQRVCTSSRVNENSDMSVRGTSVRRTCPSVLKSLTVFKLIKVESWILTYCDETYEQVSDISLLIACSEVCFDICLYCSAVSRICLSLRAHMISMKTCSSVPNFFYQRRTSPSYQSAH